MESHDTQKHSSIHSQNTYTAEEQSYAFSRLQDFFLTDSYRPLASRRPLWFRRSRRRREQPRQRREKQSSAGNSKQSRRRTYGVEVVEQRGSRGLQHSLHHVTHQVLQPAQQVLVRDEGALCLDMSVPEQTKHTLIMSYRKSQSQTAGG